MLSCETKTSLCFTASEYPKRTNNKLHQLVPILFLIMGPGLRAWPLLTLFLKASLTYFLSYLFTYLYTLLSNLVPYLYKNKFATPVAYIHQLPISATGVANIICAACRKYDLRHPSQIWPPTYILTYFTYLLTYLLTDKFTYLLNYLPSYIHNNLLA